MTNQITWTETETLAKKVKKYELFPLEPVLVDGFKDCTSVQYLDLVS